MVARLIWQTAGAPGVWQNSDDIVVYPGWNDVTVDLATSPPWAITDPNTPDRIGWAGQLITAVRFDPDEDSGVAPVPRRQHQDRRGLDRLRRRVRHQVPRQRLAVRHHRGHLHQRRPQGGFGGTQDRVEPPGRPGRQHVPLGSEPAAVRQRVGVRPASSTARTRRAPYATGPLRMTASPSPLYGVNPFGSLEGMSVSPSGARAGAGPSTRTRAARSGWTSGSTAAAPSAR